MSDSYGSLEWFRNLSEGDKAYVSIYGRDALIQKQKREAEFQQLQEQQQVKEPKLRNKSKNPKKFKKLKKNQNLK